MPLDNAHIQHHPGQNLLQDEYTRWVNFSNGWPAMNVWI